MKSCKIECPITNCNQVWDFSWYHNLIVSNIQEHLRDHHVKWDICNALAVILEQIHDKECQREKELEK